MTNDEWEKARMGKITASRVSDILAGGKGITRARYCAELAAARMTGRSHRNNFKPPEMEHGNEFEAIARNQYEIRNGVMVLGTGKEFTSHPYIDNCGASFDGMVSSGGLVEIKCPATHTFIQYKLDGVVPKIYVPQMTLQLACCTEPWADFVAYDPDLPEEDNYFQVRLMRDEKAIQVLEQEIRFFDAEVNLLIEKIIKLRS